MRDACKIVTTDQHRDTQERGCEVRVAYELPRAPANTRQLEKCRRVLREIATERNNYSGRVASDYARGLQVITSIGETRLFHGE